MKRYIPLGLALFLLAACGGEPTPTPDAVATQIAVEKAAHATMTAEAPTVTKTSLPTHTPTATATPTSTHTPTVTDTSTPTATDTSTPTQTPIPTNTPTDIPTPTWTPSPSSLPTSTPKPTSKPKPQPTPTPKPELVITYQDFHYDCVKRYWGETWGYRAFQTLMVIKNNSADKTVEAPWKPTRWIVANWRNPEETRETGRVWEWVHRDKGFYPEPSIPPGGTARWTYIAFPLDRWEYVRAAEFDWEGQTYRFEFPRPEYGGEYNMWDCGDYPGANKPTWRDPADWTIPTP
jgi:hypothetical protein